MSKKVYGWRGAMPVGGFVERQEASEMPDNAKHHASE